MPWRNALRALTEAREEVTEYEALADLMRRREQPWVSCWQKETGKPHTLPDYGEFLGWLVNKLEYTEAKLATAWLKLKNITEEIEGLLPGDTR
jgi:hypothetical protein